MADYTREVRRILSRNGYSYLRPGKGDHAIWEQAGTGRTVSVDSKIGSRHSANAVLKQAGIGKAF